MARPNSQAQNAPGGGDPAPNGTAPPRANESPASLFKPPPDDVDPRRDSGAPPALKTFDVYSLIVNKMIGTGVYSSPATVFLLTGNKSLTLGLFFVGFFYSLVSMIMYLDYAAAFPFTGGELVYLDEITAHAIDYDGTSAPAVDGHAPAVGDRVSANIELVPTRSSARVPTGGGARVPTGGERVPTTGEPAPAPGEDAVARIPTLAETIRGGIRKFFGDGLLAYITYSIIFVAIFNSGTNSMQTGRMILLCIAANEPGTPDVNRDVVRLIGVVVLTAICLLQFFSPEMGRSLNKLFAVVKILFLVALFIVAAAANSHPMTKPDDTAVDQAGDWATWYDTGSKLYFAKALLAVLFAFEGWENATFVTGEIPRDSGHVLRSGFVLAVLTVGILYVLVVAMFLQSTTWEVLKAAKENVNYAPLLTGNGTAAKRAWAIVGAISSLGSLNSIIYTFSRVKQVIGQAEILPWSRVWKRDDPIPRDPIHKAPQGGLIIHWVMSVVVIAGASSVPSTLESVSLPGYIQTYAHCFILMILGGAYLRLNSRDQELTAPEQPGRRGTGKRRTPPFRPSEARSSVARGFLAIAVVLYVATNLAILIINAIPPYGGSDGSQVAFQGFGYPIIMGCLVVFGVLYYVAVFGCTPRVYPQASQEEAPPPVREEGLFAPGAWSLLRLAGVSCEIHKDRYYNDTLERVSRFGRRWRIQYYLRGVDRQQGNDAAAAAQSDDADAPAQVQDPAAQHDAVRSAAEQITTAAAQVHALAAKAGAATIQVTAAAAHIQAAAALLGDAAPATQEVEAAPGALSRFLYWFFGGTRLRESPAEKLGRELDTIRLWP